MSSELKVEYDDPRDAVKRDQPQYVAYLGLMPTREGLPEFQGETFEDHVEAWRAVDESQQNHLWALASIAASLSKRYGNDDVGRFAYEVKCSGRHVRRLAQTYHAFENGQRCPDLSFYHHLIAATAAEPAKALKAAAAEEMSGRELARWIEREEYEARIGAAPLPEDVYRVVYADPPWNYGNSGLDEYGHAERHYDTMTTDELCALPVAQMAAVNAVLFLWATSPLLKDALRVIEAWHFDYKTSFIWDKVKHNFGYYNSVRHEFLLVATRGSCLPDEKFLHDSVVEIERTDKHSEKPEYFRELIDRLYRQGRRIELFARRPAEGWDVWGNEVADEDKRGLQDETLVGV